MEPPKRPCSAYNYFFQDERKRLLQSLPVGPRGIPRNGGHGKISFANMAKVISKRWKAISGDQMEYYAMLANSDKIRYFQEKREYNKHQRDLKKQALTAQDFPSAAISISGLQENSEFAEFHKDDYTPYMVHYPIGSQSISDLASKLEEESTIDMIIAVFK